MNASRRILLSPRWPLVALMAGLLLVAPLRSVGAVTRAASAVGGLGAPTLRVIDSPFSPDGDGHADRVFVDVALASASTVTVQVRAYGGEVVRTLAREVARDAGTTRFGWNGRDGLGALVPDGPYRVRVSALDATGIHDARAWVAKAPHPLFPAAPRSLVIAVNPGHGDPDTGATYGGYQESDLNLGIALRLRDMLVASGATVVMTRTTDTHVNEPPIDRDGNGRMDHNDEHLARNDMVNVARPDLLVTVMNNAYTCSCVRGTETFTSDQRTWTPAGIALATAIQTAQLARLAPFTTSHWHPVDRGVKFYPFASLEPYGPKRMPRPALMPSVLVESLFMSNPAELRVLTQPAVLTALAVAYFDGIGTWLAERPYGLRYRVTSAPSIAPTGGTASVQVHLTNRGNRTSAGWVLEARIVPAVPFYDGSGNPGTLVAQTPLPDGLAPGEQLDATLSDITLPATDGDWLLKLDVRLPGGKTLGDHGVVGPQLLVTTTSSP